MLENFNKKYIMYGVLAIAAVLIFMVFLRKRDTPPVEQVAAQGVSPVEAFGSAAQVNPTEYLAPVYAAIENNNNDIFSAFQAMAKDNAAQIGTISDNVERRIMPIENNLGGFMDTTSNTVTKMQEETAGIKADTEQIKKDQAVLSKNIVNGVEVRNVQVGNARTVQNLAKDLGMSVTDLLKINSGMTANSKIGGAFLNIPVKK